MLALSLIGTGITLGIVHVLTGPDHLSALATLCACESTRTSFFLGVQWGIGHSTGLLLVGGIFIAILSSTTTTTTTTTPNGDVTSEEVIEIPETVTHIFENLVGAFMVALGIYGLHRAYRRHKRNQEDEDNNNMINNNINNGTNDDIYTHPATTPPAPPPPPENLPEDDETPTGGTNHRSIEATTITTPAAPAAAPDTPIPRDSTIVVMEESSGTAIVRTRRVMVDTAPTPNANSDVFDYDEEDPYMAMVEHPDTGEDVSPPTGPTPTTTTMPPLATTSSSSSIRLDDGWSLVRCCHCCARSSNGSNRACAHHVLALLAGLVHGVAGPGGVLGVIPAVQIRNPWLGTLYLTTFCITSTLTMGCFAAFYGKLFKKAGWEFRIECASACLSLVVGILWLVLLATGKMDAVFGE